MNRKQSFADVLQSICSKNFTSFTGNHLCWRLTQVISRETYEIFKNNYFEEHPRTTASVYYKEAGY